MKTKIINDPSIVQASPIIVEEGMYPSRLVIRHLPDPLCPHQYVVHRENLKCKQVGEEEFEWTHFEFYWGNYCTTLEEAQEHFKERKR